MNKKLRNDRSDHRAHARPAQNRHVIAVCMNLIDDAHADVRFANAKRL
ncbi:MAG: hypothetical protein ABL889_01840 [Terricaulis sp.]